MLSGKSNTGGSFGLFGSLGSKTLSRGENTSVDGVENPSGAEFIEVTVDGFTEEDGFIEDVTVDGFDEGLMGDGLKTAPLSTDG